MQTASVSGNLTASGGERYFRETLGKDVGSEIILATGGASTVGFFLCPPTGGMVAFQGSWTKIKWKGMTVRQMGAHGYVSQAEDEEDYIGSCSTFNWVRFVVTRAGAAPGEIRGRFTVQPSTIEGVENQAPPHKFGCQLKSADFSFSAVTSNGTVCFPEHSYHKLVVGDIHFTVNDANTLVTFSDGSLAEGHHIYRGNIKPTGGATVFIPISFSFPHVFSGTARPLCFTQTGNATVDGVVHYYETEP